MLKFTTKSFNFFIEMSYSSLFLLVSLVALSVKFGLGLGKCSSEAKKVELEKQNQQLKDEIQELKK